MTSSRPKNQYFERAVGDGNCAFNAFILGLTQPHILNVLDHHADTLNRFVNAAAGVLGVNPIWAEVKNKIIALRAENKVALQKQIAPVMRALALSFAEKDAAHYLQTCEPFLSAYRDYAYDVLGIVHDGVADDVFSRHPFIQAQFEEAILPAISSIADDKTIERRLERLKELRWLNERNQAEQEELRELEQQIEIYFEQARKYLLSWWEKRGYRQFLNKMRQDGEWAGDLELSQLARYFHVDLNVQRADFIYPITFNNGVMPIRTVAYDLTQEEIKTLADQEIIDRPQPKDTALRLLPVSRERMVQVVKRPEIIAAWDKNYIEQPSIFLINEHGAHWDSMSATCPEQSENAAAQVSQLEKDTLAMLQAGSICHDAKRWDMLLARAHAVGKLRSHSLFAKYYVDVDEPELAVSKNMQESLDEELARKLQLEEYECYLKAK